MAFKKSEQMDKTTFEITKMDCPSEERLIRMKLDNFSNIKNLDFDLEKRRLTVYHNGLTNEIEKSIDDLKLNSKRIGTEKITTDIKIENQKNERQLLWTVLLINFGFFCSREYNGTYFKINGTCSRQLGHVGRRFSLWT
jgi:cation transport ATPase